MKINANQIPPEGLRFNEELNSQELDLDTEIIKFRSPVSIAAEVYRITNAVTVKLALSAALYFICSRCLQEFEGTLNKNVEFNYAVNKYDQIIDLDPDIREEIMLDYPMKPLCRKDCNGLCPKCGKDLNQGGCGCGST